MYNKQNQVSRLLNIKNINFDMLQQYINNILINQQKHIRTYIFKLAIMFDWIFGSSKEKKQEKKVQKQQQVLAKEDLWAYDFIKQYLVSPIWRNPLLDFIQQNCLIFDDSEQNKFQYTKIHKQFTQLCALLIQSITQQTGISEKLLEQCIFKGITDKNDHKIFNQILLCDNFLAFKKIMVAKNKQLQIAAIQAENKKKGINQTAEQQKIDEKELERLEIEKAIALSLAMDEKLKMQEEKELQQAIRLSQLEAEKEEKKKQSSPSKLGPLPPIVIGSNRSTKPVSEYKQQQQILIKQIQTLKIKQQSQKKQDENSQQRKKRLLQQRELIRKKKMQERKEELNNFVQNKAGSEKEQAPKVSQQELQRRKKLMQRLKEQLKD